MAICIVERWEKVVATVLFLSAVLHRQVIHVIFSTSFPGFSPTRSTEREGRGNEVGHFFSAIFAGPRFCWDPDLLLAWQRDLTTSFLYLAVKLIWGEGEGGLRLSSVAALGSLYSFSRAFRTPCLLGYFNGDVIDSLISSSAFITTPFMVTDRKAWQQRRKEANKV